MKTRVPLLCILAFAGAAFGQITIFGPSSVESSVPADRPMKSAWVTGGSLAANSWTTVLNHSGPSGVVFLWKLDVTCSGTDVRNARVRLTMNGAAVPQFGGTNGMLLEDVWGYGHKINGIYSTPFIGISQNTGSFFCAWWGFPLPFQSSFKLEVFNPSASGGTIWAQMDFVEGTQVPQLPLGNWVLYAMTGTAAVAPLEEATLVDTGTKSTALLRVFQDFVGDANFKFLEGDHRIYVSGTTLIYQNNGTEDFNRSSNYNDEGTYQEIYDRVYTRLSGTYSGDRNFPLETIPIYDKGMKLTWQSGDAGQIFPTGTTILRNNIFWYQKQ